MFIELDFDSVPLGEPRPDSSWPFQIELTQDENGFYWVYRRPDKIWAKLGDHDERKSWELQARHMRAVAAKRYGCRWNEVQPYTVIKLNV